MTSFLKRLNVSQYRTNVKRFFTKKSLLLYALAILNIHITLSLFYGHNAVYKFFTLKKLYTTSLSNKALLSKKMSTLMNTLDNIKAGKDLDYIDEMARKTLNYSDHNEKIIINK